MIARLIRGAVAVLAAAGLGLALPASAMATGSGSSGAGTVTVTSTVSATSGASAISGGDGTVSTAAHGRIDHVEAGGPGKDVQVLFSIPGLGKDAVLDKGSVQLTVNGKPITAKVSTVSGAVRRTAILAIDISGSMKGPKFDAATQAALDYVAKAPADVYIGLITFSVNVNIVQPPTLDRKAMVSAIKGMKIINGGTLYEAIKTAIELAGTQGGRSVLLLTDGLDAVHSAPASLMNLAKNSGVRLDVIGLYKQPTERVPLQDLSAATGGLYTATFDLAAVNTLFTREAQELQKQVLLTFPVPAGLTGTDGSLQVSMVAGNTRYSDHGYVTLGSAAAPAPVAGPDYVPIPTPAPIMNVSNNLMYGGIAVLVLGVGALLAYGLTRLAPAKQAEWQRQMKFYTTKVVRTLAPASAGADSVNLKRSALRVADRLMSSRDLEALLTKKLQSGAVRFTAAEWMLLHVGIVVVSGLIGLFAGGVVPMIVLIVLGIVLPWGYLSFKESRRKKAFASQLADTLQVMSGGLQAGQSLPQAVDTAAKEGADPVASEFRKAIVEQRLGVDITDSLDDVAERMGSKDFRWVVMAIRIQREVGGNLAELLRTVAETLREREYLRRQVRTLSAEGRLSAWIIGGLPPVFVIYLILVRGQYLAPMLHNKLGWFMIGYAVVSMIAGIFWLSRVVKVDA